MSELSIEERVALGGGFSVGHDHLGRIDRLSDEALATTEAALRAVVGQAEDALRAINLVREQRYDHDSISRIGRYAIE